VTKVEPGGNCPRLFDLCGGDNYDYGNAIAVDSGGNAYVAGYSYSTNFPTVNAIQGANAGGGDIVAFKLNPSGNGLLYSTYFGGTGSDLAYGVAVDGSGNAYITGESGSADLPVTAGVAGATYAGIPTP